MTSNVITCQRWQEFFDLVWETRQLQQNYRRTIDSRIRRRAEEKEFILDTMIESFTFEMAAAAVEVEAAIAASAEGGAP